MKDDRKESHDQLPSSKKRIVYEYDFFDDNRSGPKKKHVLPLLQKPLKEEALFPGIILDSPSSSQETLVSSSSPKKRKTSQESHVPVPDITTITNPNPHEEVGPSQTRPPQLDPGLVELIKALPVLLFEKKLELSDVRQSQNRLLIARREGALMGYLTDEEKEKVVASEKESVFKVTTLDPDQVEYTMHLRKWPKMGAIVLNHEWFKFVMNNSLKKGDTVQGWGYRLRSTNQFRLTLSFIRNTTKIIQES